MYVPYRGVFNRVLEVYISIPVFKYTSKMGVRQGYFKRK